MTRNFTTPAVRGRIARHLGRLRHDLDALGEQVRQSVADAVGRAAAEAVGEAVFDVLSSRASSQPSRPARSARPPSPSGRYWDEPGGRGQPDDALWREPYASEDDLDDAPRSFTGPELDEPPSAPYGPRRRRWQEALVASLQAATWWLRRQRGAASVLAALAVGAVAGLTVLVGPTGPAAGLVASALGLAYLHELVRSAGDLLTPTFSPARTPA